MQRSLSSQVLFNSRLKNQIKPSEALSLRDGTNAYELLLECHINVAMCQIRQQLFLHAIVTLTTILQYSRRNAQAYYLRGKCYFCLFDYRSAYLDISECLEIHKSHSRSSQTHILGGQDANSHHKGSNKQTGCPVWLEDFHTMLGKKVSGAQVQERQVIHGTQMTPLTTQLTQLSRLINKDDQGDARMREMGKMKGMSRRGDKSIKTNSTNSSRVAEMESYAWIDRMWKFYLPERVAKRPLPSLDKLFKMIWAKINERVRSFDAQFLLFWVFIVFYLGVRKRLFFKIGWLIFRQIKQFQTPVPKPEIFNSA